MLTGALVKALEHASGPRSVRALNWMLEKRYGITASELLQRKAVIGSFNTSTVSDWYARNGYRGIAGLGGSMSHAGIAIHEQAVLESSAVYGCTKIFGEDMGSLPWFTYERSRDRKKVDFAIDHPLFPTLKNLVNPETSSGEFVEALTTHIVLGLDGFAWIERRAGFIYLWQWQPVDVRTERDSRGNLYYLHKEGYEWKTYARRNVFHLRGFSFDAIRGDPFLTRARQVLGLTLAAQEYAGRYFANDATPGIVLKRPIVQGVKQEPWGPDTIKNLKAAWKEWHQGLAKSHEPAILQDGVDVQLLTPNAEQSQITQQREFQVIEVARMMRMPLFKLADLKRAIQSNAEQQAIEYELALLPIVRRWKDAVYRCLLTTDEQQADRIYAEHDTKILMRADFRSQAEGFRNLLEKGVYNIDEVRRWLNLNPLPDGAGQNHFIQLNMGTVQDVATGATIAKNETGTMPASGVREDN
jgi:HK97 family phage portal protein